MQENQLYLKDETHSHQFMKLPDPLDINYLSRRILSDKGIKQAIDLGLVRVTPAIDFSEEERVQPATLDVKIKSIESLDLDYPRKRENLAFIHDQNNKEKILIPARSKVMIKLTEMIEFAHMGESGLFVAPQWEARSSVRRMGMYNANLRFFFNDPENSHIEMGNYSDNDIIFTKGDRIAQLFFVANPFADNLNKMFDKEYNPTIGEKARSLDMGIQIRRNDEVNELQKQGLMKISPRLSCNQGMILVHASNTAYRLKKLDEPIDFSNKKKYNTETLLEPINITKGYEIKPYEHIVIETQENFELSDKVGIWFYDNLAANGWSKKVNYQHMDNMVKMIKNSALIDLPDGWIDPGYIGGFSRQPKWVTTMDEETGGRIIKPGDIIGHGACFYFPKGVKRAYGTIKGSQWQNDNTTKII